MGFGVWDVGDRFWRFMLKAIFRVQGAGIRVQGAFYMNLLGLGFGI